MARSGPEETKAPTPFSEALYGGLAIAMLSVLWYFLVGLLNRIDAISGSRVITAIQYGVPAVLGLFFGLGALIQLREAAQARRAHAQVAEVLDVMKDESHADVAGLSVEALAEAVRSRGVSVSDDQLVRLVQQRQQQLLIDDEYFRSELSHLIVDYLQPLPRNAKRVLNRFRVNLLIAHGRGLFTTEPKVTAQQIGKWLVLAERWPQLARSLSAAPERMGSIESQAGPPLSGDAFVKSMRMLAPFYEGDEDLRNFINSRPALAGVLPRLVHYGSETPTVAKDAPLGTSSKASGS